MIAGVSNTPLTFSDNSAVVKPYQYPTLSPFGTYNFSSLDQLVVNYTGYFVGLGMSIFPVTYKRISYEASLAFLRRNWNVQNEGLRFENTYGDLSTSMKFNFALDKPTQPFIDAGVNIGLSLKSDYNAEMITRDFTKAGPAGGADRVTKRVTDTWPETFPVDLLLLEANQYKPTFFTPFASIGLDRHFDKFIASIGFRYGFAGRLTTSTLYTTRLGYQNIFISIRKRA
ncbi:MAG: hypothetical protein AB7K37_08175 [Cyclobacteriaceae bacterium]